MMTVSPVITGITFAFTYRTRCIIIIIIIIISFMQGIYTYIPETNYIPTEYSLAAILLLLFMVLISVSVFNLLFIFIIIMSLMQGIYTYIPGTNYVPREYSVAAILLLLFMVLYLQFQC